MSTLLDQAAPTIALRDSCPLCEASSQLIFVKYGYPIRQCESCRHRFAGFIPNDKHLASIYDDAYFFDGGHGYPNYLKNEKLLVGHGQRLAKKIQRHTKPGMMLDVGCAAGFVMKGFQLAGWEATGIEPNRQMAEFATEFCEAEVQVGTLRSATSDEPTRLVDLVTLIQVIAHVEEPRVDIELALRHLKPGGLCFVETWNLDSYAASLLGQGWHEYSPPSVLHWFRFDRLEALFAEFGCECVDRGRLVKWIMGHHGKSLLEDKLPEIPGGNLIKPIVQCIPDNLACPYLSDDLGWLLFRKAA